MNNKYLKYDIVYSSCFLQTLYEQIKYTVNKEDIYASLAQPIGFGLDIDVLSRNWWLGSYSEINYFNPFFEFNIECVYKNSPFSVHSFFDLIFIRFYQYLCTITHLLIYVC